MNDWLHSKPINDVMIELPILRVIPDTQHVTLGSSAEVALTYQGHALIVRARCRAFLSKKVHIDPWSGISALV